MKLRDATLPHEARFPCTPTRILGLHERKHGRPSPCSTQCASADTRHERIVRTTRATNESPQHHIARRSRDILFSKDGWEHTRNRRLLTHPHGQDSPHDNVEIGRQLSHRPPLSTMAPIIEGGIRRSTTPRVSLPTQTNRPIRQSIVVDFHRERGTNGREAD